MVSASKSAATGDKKKSKKSSRPSSKDKDRKTKDKDKDRKSSSKRQREKTPPAPPPEPAASTPTPTPPPPVSVVHDPDAIQLFRRYDRNRSGVLTRLDFLQLLRDYADPTSGWGTSLSRPPLSLTDTSGIPLGYQRADRNSEFEAGQLFERYDRDHTGALSLDTFHAFFADFKPQLRAFVEEGNYRALARPPPVAVAPVPLHPVQEEEPVPQVRDAATGGDTPLPTPKVIRAPSQYEKQADLESLLRVKDQMIYQLLQERTAMRKERAAVETSLRKLSEVSTREIKKWARLTDDMQTEIEQLRSQLRLQAQQRHAMTTR